MTNIKTDDYSTSFEILQKNNFEFIKLQSNGTFQVPHNKTTYYNVYVKDGKIRQL